MKPTNPTAAGSRAHLSKGRKDVPPANKPKPVPALFQQMFKVKK